MASTGRKWLIGCGVGCGLLVVVLGIGAISFGLFLRSTVRGFGEAVEVREQLEERFGRPDEYVPPPEGAISAERMEAFLSIRDATQPYRERIADTWSAFPMTREQQQELDDKPVGDKLRAVFRISREAFGMARELGDFFLARNRAMLAREMGLGEYTYVYALAYWSWLGHRPDSGPEHVVVSEEGQVRIGPGTEVHTEIAEDVYEDRIHGQLLSMIEHQLSALPEEHELRAALEAEIAAMEDDPQRVPWQEGLPAPVVASLEPYRDRLESSWDPSVNPFELARNRKQGWSIRAD